MAKSKMKTHIKEQTSPSYLEPYQSDSLIYYGLIFTAAIIAIVFSPTVADTFGVPKFITTFAGSTLLLTIWLVNMLRQQKPRVLKTGANLPIILFLIINVTSTVFSTSWTTSLVGHYSRFDGLLSIIAYAIVFFLSTQVFPGKTSRVIFALKAITITATLVSIYGLLQYFGLDPAPWQSGIFELNRSFSTFGNPVHLGSYLVMILPLALSLVLTTKKPAQAILFGLCFLLIAASTITTFSRGAWIASIISLLAFILIGKQSLSDIQKKRLFIGISVLLLAVIIISVTSASTGDVTSVGGRLKSFLELGGPSGISRLEIWKGALHMVADRPLTGFGIDTFRSAFFKYETLKYLQMRAPNETAGNSHNYFLQTAATVGIFGLLAFLFLVIQIFLYGARTIKDKENKYPLIYAGILAGLLAYLVSLLFGINMQAGMVTFLLMAGMVTSAPFAINIASIRRIDIKWRRPSEWRLAGIIVAVGVEIILLAVCARLYYADTVLASANDFSGLNNLVSAVQEYRRANQLFPYSSYYNSLAGEALYKLAMETKNPITLDESEQYLKTAIALNPLEFDNYIILSQVYMFKGRNFDQSYMQTAIDELNLSTTMRRYPALSYFFLGQIYSEKGSYKLALYYLNKVIKIDPKFEDARVLAMKVSNLLAAGNKE
ncbi:MAG: O-antigen ligase family protein [Actinomycetota bacterium]